MKKPSLSVKLNALASGVIFAVALAISAAAVVTIDQLTDSLARRMLVAELRTELEKVEEAREVLVDSGVGDVPSYINSTQSELLERFKNFRTGYGGRLYVLADSGALLQVPEQRHAKDLSKDVVARIFAQGVGSIELEVAGQQSLLILGEFKPWGWRLVLAMPLSEINAQRNQFLSRVAVILGLSVLSGGLLFAWVAGRFVQPIRSLSRRMASLTEDSLGSPLDLKSDSLEVAELQNSFEQMTHRLHAAGVEKKRSEEAMWHQANYDSLTDLPNRRMFHDRLQQAIQYSERRGSTVALLFLDLDNFKDVNDTLGHDQGDLLLVEAARRLSKCVRQSDTLARLGGDEFTIVLTDAGDPAQIDRVARKVLQELARPFQLATDLSYVSTSIGITLYPNDAKNMDEMLRHADQAMFMAKRDGRNCYRYFTRELQAAALSRVQLINDLHQAMAAKQFTLHYQPIVEMATGQIRKAEALIRWAHPGRGWVNPAEFIQVAEQTGLIHQLGDWVFHEAASQVSKWRQTLHPDFQVFVNTSPLQYISERASVLAWIEHLEALQLPGVAMGVEITEGILMQGERGAAERLSLLRQAGLQVSLDDFGTGYSSLSYLRKFAIDFLKIDKSFVTQLESSESDRALCEAIIVMAHKLKLRVIAEGVETQAQQTMLWQMGCDFGQGYFMARPVAADAFDLLVRRANLIPA